MVPLTPEVKRIARLEHDRRQAEVVEKKRGALQAKRLIPRRGSSPGKGKNRGASRNTKNMATLAPVP
jgi:hypothetical protein